MQHIDQQNLEIKTAVEKEARRRHKIKKELEDEKFKNLQIQKQIRKNDIIVFNLEYKEGDLLSYTVDKLNNLLQINLDKKYINNVFTIGKTEENKPIIIQFEHYWTKKNIYGSCKLLKGTKIRISEILTTKEFTGTESTSTLHEEG
ncbi:unnamed protein product [Psylliodes chrysocephalus]|uniref:Uncharacterized protein n=1 Tax=Psylliodes chrysocephalus TaxID=3402493 RepID=A0A9P0CT58_9CUCU|nr:unnamed protein product [Psylliodes chrysocephala]